MIGDIKWDTGSLDYGSLVRMSILATLKPRGSSSDCCGLQQLQPGRLSPEWSGGLLLGFGLKGLRI